MYPRSGIESGLRLSTVEEISSRLVGVARRFVETRTRPVAKGGKTKGGQETVETSAYIPRSSAVMGAGRETRRRLTPAMRVRLDTLRRVGSTACHRGASSCLNISVYTTANHVDDAIRGPARKTAAETEIDGQRPLPRQIKRRGGTVTGLAATENSPTRLNYAFRRANGPSVARSSLPRWSSTGSSNPARCGHNLARFRG